MRKCTHTHKGGKILSSSNQARYLQDQCPPEVSNTVHNINLVQKLLLHEWNITVQPPSISQHTIVYSHNFSCFQTRTIANSHLPVCKLLATYQFVSYGQKLHTLSSLFRAECSCINICTGSGCVVIAMILPRASPARCVI